MVDEPTMETFWLHGGLPLIRVDARGTLTALNPACVAVGAGLVAGQALAEWLAALGGSEALVEPLRDALGRPGAQTLQDEELELRLLPGEGERLLTVQARVGGVTPTELLHERQVRDAISRMAEVGGWEVDLRTMTPRWDAETFRIHEVPLGEQPPMDQAIEFYAPEARPVIQEAVGQAIADGTPFDHELPMITATGRRIWVRAIGSCDHHEGEAVRLWGVFQDITARTEQRLALEKAYDRARQYERLFDTSPALVCTATLEGWFDMLNDAWTQALGWTLEELRDRPFVSFVHPEDVANTLAESARLGTPGTRSVHFENRYQHKSGGWRWLSWHAFSTDGQIYAVALDITKERALREEREARERALVEARDEAARLAETALAAVRARSAFMASMSHEIRTPMNAVLGIAQLLLDSDLAPEQTQLAEQLLASGRSLLRLLNDQLDLSKAEAGMMRLDPAPFALREVLDMVVGLYAESARARGLTLELQVPDAIPPWLEGDAGRLRQVLFNLVGNGVKFTERGRVELRVVRGEGERWRFEVHDTGIGIAAEAQERIFDPYQQVDDSATRRFAGSGLGLAISRQLVALMGGELRVDSRPGEGARFSFEIPLRPASRPRALPAAPKRALPEDLQVLVAEDNVVNQQVAAAMLEGRGVNVTVVGDGAEALAHLERARVDAVLMDWHMPRVDGLSATREMRARGDATPVVMLTARVSDEDAREAHEAGADAFLAKPVAWDALLETLQRVVTRRV